METEQLIDESFSPEQYGAKLFIDKGVNYFSDLPIVIDVETNEQDLVIGLAWTQDGKSVTYVTSEHFDYIKKMLVTCNLVGHNEKGDLKWLINSGISLKSSQLYFDTCLASYVQCSTKESHGLKDLAKEYLGMEWPTYREMVGSGKKKQTLDKQPVERVARYCGLDCLATYRLWKYFEKKLTPNEKRYLETIELPTARVLLDMELKGAKVDVPYLEELKTNFTEQLLGLESAIKSHWNKETTLNVNSNKQIAELLESQGITLPRTQKGNKKVDKQTLLQYADLPVVTELLEYSKIEKLLSTYVLPLLEKNVNGRIYAQYNQITKGLKGETLGISTGRLCVHPDTLVEVPRDLSKHPDGIPLKDLKVGDYVYSLDWEKRLCLRKILWVGETKKKETLLVKVKNKWGKTTEFKLSKDHLVRMFKGEWKPAGQLKVGNRLCGFVRRGFGDYAYFFPSSKNRRRGESGGRMKEHRFVYAQTHGIERLPSQWDVHHKDHNKLNNSPMNLDFIMHESHMKMHRKKTTKQQIEQMIRTGNVTLHKKVFRRKCKEFGLAPTNHTVVSIEEIGVHQLWDLEVEDTHAFFGGEVLLHNSSSHPNLQNIPTRTEEGELLRKAFIAEPGKILIDADYSSIEPRLVAHFSKDPVFVRAFTEGKDIYQEIVEGTGRDRQDGKTFMLALLYGAQPKKLASVFKSTEQEAEQIIQKIMSKLPGVAAWKTRLVYEARRKKGVFTLFRRWIPLPGIDSPNRFDRMHWERAAINYTIQGSAAEIMKLALIKLADKGMVPIITVHDSIILEWTDKSYALAAEEAKNIMESVTSITVPLLSDVGCGKSWRACDQEM